MIFFEAFCLTLPKNLAEELFCVSKIFRYRKNIWIRKMGWMEYHDFPYECFCLTVRKNSYRKPSLFYLISGVEKFYASEGYVMIFCRTFFCLTVSENLVGEPFCVSKLSATEKTSG